MLVNDDKCVLFSVDEQLVYDFANKHKMHLQMNLQGNHIILYVRLYFIYSFSDN